ERTVIKWQCFCPPLSPLDMWCNATGNGQHALVQVQTHHRAIRANPLGRCPCQDTGATGHIEDTSPSWRCAASTTRSAQARKSAGTKNSSYTSAALRVTCPRSKSPRVAMCFFPPMLDARYVVNSVYPPGVEA